MLVPVRDNEAARSPRRPGRDRSESVSQGYAHWSKCVWGRNRLCIDPIGFHGLSTRKWSRRPQVSCQVRMGCHASLMALPFSAALLSTAHLLYEEQPALQAAPHGGGVTGSELFTSAGSIQRLAGSNPAPAMLLGTQALGSTPRASFVSASGKRPGSGSGWPDVRRVEHSDRTPASKP